LSLVITLCLLTIFIIFSLNIGTVNLEDKFFEPSSAQANINTNHNTTDSNSIQNNISLITNILAKNLENRIQKAGAILEITSKLPQVRDVPYAHLLNQTLNTLHGIPQYADIEKDK
jgi:cell division protein FtsX